MAEETYIILSNLPAQPIRCLLSYSDQVKAPESLEEKPLPRNFSDALVMGLTDFRGTHAKPSLPPATQQFLEDLLDNIPEEEMAQAMATIDQCWVQRASGLASHVNAVSDYVSMPSVAVGSSEVKEMMNLLDALPQGIAKEIEKVPEGQWKSTVQLGLLKAEKQFFPCQSFEHHTVLRGFVPQTWHKDFPEESFVFM